METIVSLKKGVKVKQLYLLKGGKGTLIKSTLSNLPTYFLSFSYSSGGCNANCIEQLQ